MNQITLEQMKQMRLYGMHNAFLSAIETGNTNDYTLDQFIASLIEAESNDRHNRKIERLIKNARFKYSASVEKIAFGDKRNLDANTFHRLLQNNFITKAENVLITGSTGVGKSYLATAIGYQACVEGKRVVYYNSVKLFAKLKMAKANGSYLKEMTKLERQHLIILDDFGLQTLDQASRLSLLEILEDRYSTAAVIITSQLPISGWYEMIGEKTIADAIMDRLLHRAHRIELKGESMRKKRTNRT